MKKLFLLLTFVTAFTSCDFILKDRSKDKKTEVKPEEKVVLGMDKDDKGCVTSAGYKWSEIRKECVRVSEEGYRLNQIQELEEEDASASAFVLFEKDGDRAELYLPDAPKAIMLKQSVKNGAYKNKEYSLQSKTGYTLKKNGTVIYAGAAVQENQVTGDDSAES